MREQVEPNRVRVQVGGHVTEGTVVAIYNGGHAHTGPSEVVEVVALNGGGKLGIFCRWCRQRVDDGPAATMLPDTTAVCDDHLRTYAN